MQSSNDSDGTNRHGRDRRGRRGRDLEVARANCGPVSGPARTGEHQRYQ